MRSKQIEIRKLLANFFANIGVAWFSAGVIGAFLNRTDALIENMKSVTWGILFSTIFLMFGANILTKGRSR